MNLIKIPHIPYDVLYITAYNGSGWLGLCQLYRMQNKSGYLMFLLVAITHDRHLRPVHTGHQMHIEPDRIRFERVLTECAFAQSGSDPD